MRNNIVTIVIPVYNVECYLNRCLESIVNQTYRELEIILIDDCSTDGSLQLCDHWAQRDSRVQVVSLKKNEGAGMARNIGIEAATGEYVIFVDSDDYLRPDAVEKCMACAQKHQVQSVVFGHCDINENGALVGSGLIRGKEEVFEGPDVVNIFLPDLVAQDPADKQTGVPSCARAMMFDTKTLRENGWRFVSEREIISEDVYSLLEVFYFVKKVAALPEHLYFYCENRKSITHSYREDYYQKIKGFYLKTIGLCERCTYGWEIRRRLVFVFLSFTIAALKQESRTDKSLGNQLRAIKEIVDDKLLQEKLLETRKEKHSIARRLLFLAMRRQKYFMCWAMLKAKG